MRRVLKIAETLYKSQMVSIVLVETIQERKMRLEKIEQMQKIIMKKLNDYLYLGDTVLKILQKYAEDLKQSAKETNNQIDLLHCNFLLQIAERSTTNS